MTERDFIMKMRIDLELQKQEAQSRVQRAEQALRIAKEDYENIAERKQRLPNPNDFNEDELLNM